MKTVRIKAPSRARPVTSPRRRFTADEVLRMVETGVLREDEPVELLDGELVVVSPQGPLHGGVLTTLQERLCRAYGRGYLVRAQLPLASGPWSLPEPDLAVVATASWLDRHPRGDEAALVVEIAGSSQAIDRDKAAIYARAGVAVYWILDLVARRLEVRTGPRPGGTYTETTVLDARASVPVPGSKRSFRVTSLLP